MARKLTTHKAALHLQYVARQEAAGRMTPALEGIREHRLAFLKRSKACLACGRKIENPDSLKAWQQDGFGPECRQRLEVAS